jgi:hypothetical protein
MTNAYFDFLKNNIRSITYFKASLVISTLSFICWIFYYMGYTSLNTLSVLLWLGSGFLLFYSLLPKTLQFKKEFLFRSKRTVAIILGVAAVYWITHLWNFSSAPWNSFGLFDDAAWDIYFAKNYVLTGVPFQPAYFDYVGYISREVVFHYYITLFFKVFGYNLLSFNVSLLVLGFITVLFTVLIADKLFRNTKITIISFLIINFFPLHFMHIFMGHRYAMAAPLMTISLFFLYRGFSVKSLSSIFFSALFTFLCWDSAIMGKQYLAVLLVSGITFFLLQSFQKKNLENLHTGLVYLLSFIVVSSPFLMYILFNYSDYSGREGGLVRDFINNYREGGIGLYVNKLNELFFGETTYLRQFMTDNYIIPPAYYLLLIPGLLISLMRKRLEIFLMSVVPTLGAFISGAYDFRVLLSVPVWVIAMCFTIDFIDRVRIRGGGQLKIMSESLVFVVLIIGMIPSVIYLHKVSRDPNYQYLLPHKDVAISRVVQDIVVGSGTPSDNLKSDELNRSLNSNIQHDTLVCPYSAYAIIHLYLQNYDDKKILSFCDQGIQMLKTEPEILSNNLTAINTYMGAGKNLKLIWEESDKTVNIISAFREFRKYGSDQIINGRVDGKDYSLYVLTVENANIDRFKEDVARLHI